MTVTRNIGALAAAERRNERRGPFYSSGPLRSCVMLDARPRAWDEDAVFAVSIALYLYLAFGAVHAWAHVVA